MERSILIQGNFLQQMLKWVLSHAEEQYDPASKTVKAFSLCSPWGSTVPSICLKRFYLFTSIHTCARDRAEGESCLWNEPLPL